MHVWRAAAVGTPLRDVLTLYGRGQAEILRTRTGKPYVEGGPEVSLSHSGGIALVAVAGSRRVGVDVEAPREALDWAPLARRFLAPPERDEIASLRDAARAGAFLACWTRKEAVLKATGEGIAGVPASFAVPVAPLRPAGTAPIGAVERDGTRFALHALEEPLPGWHASLAVEGGGASVLTLALEHG